MIVIAQNTTTMLPLEAETLEDLVLIAVHNIRLFDRARFADWLLTRPSEVRALARTRPPDRIYRLVSDNERSGKERPMVYGIVLGYAGGTRGEPAMCIVQVLGVKSGAGAHDTPLRLPADVLIDVTAAAFAGQLVT